MTDAKRDWAAEIQQPDLTRKIEVTAIQIAWELSENPDYPAGQAAGRRFLIKRGIPCQTGNQAH